MGDTRQIPRPAGESAGPRDDAFVVALLGRRYPDTLARLDEVAGG